MKRTLRVFLLLLCISALAACGEEDRASTASQLAVEDFAFSRLDDGTRLFTGKVYNPTGESVREAQIGVSLLDDANRQVGTTTIRVSDIAPRDTTTFRQIFDSDQDVSAARMRRLTVM